MNDAAGKVVSGAKVAKPPRWSRLGIIFWAFLRMAPVTFGGGYAIIPVLEREAVQKRRWIAEDEVADMLAVSQTIPGAVALNAAAFIGFRVAGVAGAVAAVIGMMLPTFLIVLALASLLTVYHDHPKVAAALMGMKPAVVALIAYAGFRVSRTAFADKLAIWIAVAAAIVLLLGFVSPIVVIVTGAAVGIAIGVWRRRRGIVSKQPARPHESEPDYFLGEGI